MLKPIMKLGSTAIITLAMLSALSGCSMMVARSGLSGLGEIPDGLSRKEVQERYGSPASSGATNVGRPVEVYHIRQKTDSIYSWLGGTGGGIGPGAGLGALGIIILGETAGFPIALAMSESNKLEVAFVYGADDRVLYFYETKSTWRYDQALRTLTHPLSSEAELAKCPSAKECMERYMEEVHKRAQEVGINQADQKALGVLLYLVIRPLLDSVLKEIDLGKCEKFAECVGRYVEEVRTQATRFNYTLTSQDQETLQEALKIAKRADDGEIARDEALSKLHLVPAQHLMDLWLGRS